MKKAPSVFPVVLFVGVALLFWITSCSPPQKAEPVKTASIPDDAYDPAVWGKVYPLEYDSYMATKNMRPPLSKYKKGFDTDGIIYDKLSEFPFMALLFNGWGFGVEYNEPRGHSFMLSDQLEIDPSRVKAGGACLTCKSPYVPQLMQEMGSHYYSDPYLDVHGRIPAEWQKLGVACINCHNNKDMALKIHQPPLKKALADIGLVHTAQPRQEMRSLVCAQCHVTYVVPKDAENKSTNVFFPWQGSRVGDIPIENIIRVIRSDSSNGEWKQAVTGFKFGFIRHPEYELYSRKSVHWMANVSCADCHMPYMRVGASKISNHNVMSPIKDEMKACQQCHTENPSWLKDQVIAIQDRTVSLLNRAGYTCAVTAKLFEQVHKYQAEGKSFEAEWYDRAKDLYTEAFYRVIFAGAENSVGFHNPSEIGRILGDAIAMAAKAEGLLRQLLAKEGISPGSDIQLEMAKYLTARGSKALNFNPAFEFQDPFGNQDKLVSRSSMGLP